jgi:site-specific recombinase XerD
MNQDNQEIINDFVSDIRLGKPILRQKKKPVSKKTSVKYKNWLIKISEWLNNKNFNQITEKDIDVFRKKLNKDEIRARNNKPYSNSTKRDIEYKIMGMFFKWLGKPELVYYTDQYAGNNEIPSLSKNEVEKVINASKLRDKVVFAILYDGGLRASEFLNLTFNDIIDDERESKGYYKVRIRISKTKPRTIGLFLEITTSVLDSWLGLNKDKIGTNNKLVDLTYRHLNLNIKRIGKNILKKRVYAHLLRHSSATYYCHKLSHYQLSKRYGWSMSSNMPDVYIDREGISDDEIGERLKEEQTKEYRKEINRLHEQLNIVQDKIKILEERECLNKAKSLIKRYNKEDLMKNEV